MSQKKEQRKRKQEPQSQPSQPTRQDALIPYLVQRRPPAWLGGAAAGSDPPATAIQNSQAVHWSLGATVDDRLPSGCPVAAQWLSTACSPLATVHLFDHPASGCPTTTHRRRHHQNHNPASCASAPQICVSAHPQHINAASCTHSLPPSADVFPFSFTVGIHTVLDHAQSKVTSHHNALNSTPRSYANSTPPTLVGANATPNASSLKQDTRAQRLKPARRGANRSALSGRRSTQ